MAEDLSNADHLGNGAEKGFVAPPALVDLDHDNIKDIIVNAVDGRMLALNGKNHQVIWAGKIPETEAYSTPAIGDVTGDGVPDVFASFAVGVWPNMGATRPFLVDGKKGKIAFIDSIGFYQMSSPVMADFNNDNHLDVLINLNFFGPNDKNEKIIYNTLLVYDIYQQEKYPLGQQYVGSNVGSTPWVGDLDQDGFFGYCILPYDYS